MPKERVVDEFNVFENTLPSQFNSKYTMLGLQLQYVLASGSFFFPRKENVVERYVSLWVGVTS